MIGRLVLVVLVVLGAPLLGALLNGADRILTARMQGRIGPPLLQPFYDVIKLFCKERIVARRSQNFYILFFFVLTVFTGALFFCGSDLLLVIFALTLSGIFFVLGAYKASSRRTSFSAAARAVPDPAKKSITISPSLEDALIILSSNASGF